MNKYIFILILISIFILGYYSHSCPMNPDLNKDGKVDIIDASIFFHYYGK